MGKREQTLGHIEGEEGEGGGGPEDTESYRLRTGSKQANFLREEKLHVLFNANIHPDRYQILASPKLATVTEQAQKETEGRLKGKKLNKGQR